MSGANGHRAFFLTWWWVAQMLWSVDPDAEMFTRHSPYNSMMNSPMVLNDPNGDNPLLIGAIIGIIGNGIGNTFSGESFFKGAGQAAFFGAFGGGASNIIGTVAGRISSGLGKAAFQAGAHGFVGGSISAAQGGNFFSGFAAGSFSSGVSSGIDALKGGAGAQIFGGTLAGGVGSSLAGGNFWEGAVQGALTSGLNHAAHYISDHIPAPKDKKLTGAFANAKYVDNSKKTTGRHAWRLDGKLLEWDYQHGELEMYDKTGKKHEGAYHTDGTYKKPGDSRKSNYYRFGSSPLLIIPCVPCFEWLLPSHLRPQEQKMM